MSKTRHPRAIWVALFVTVAVVVPERAQTDEAGGTLALAPLETRQDRLVRIAGERAEHLIVECSVDKGRTWQPATIYHSDAIHDWQRDGKKVWDAGALKGFLKRGAADCLWNYFFDVPMPRDSAMLRFKSAKTGEVLQQEEVDLRGAGDVVVLDNRHFADLAGGALPSPWHLAPGERKTPAIQSLVAEYDAVGPSMTLNLEKLGLKGWYRVYVGQEAMASVFFKFSKEPMQYEVADFEGKTDSWYDRPMREYYLRSADMTGQDLVLTVGGSIYPKPAMLHHVRLVPMSDAELSQWQGFRASVEKEGRPFAAYLEQCTAATKYSQALSMREYTRGEMWKHKLRGATDVYVHVGRCGQKVWYDSDIVERCVFEEGEGTEAWRNVTVWMKQGDMLAAAIEEGRAAGLKVFADVGMNRTQIGNAKPHYAVVSEAQPKAHPEWLCKGTPTYLDYRSSGARDYVVSILREVLMKYGPDGVHCDYLRWPYRHAYDEASLIDVGKRIHEARLEAQEKWGHPILIATRIPSYKAERNDTWDNGYAGEHPEFLAALKVWATEAYIDRVMPASMGFTPEISLTRYHDAIVGTEVELWGNLYGHSRSGSYTGSVELARRWAGEGMDGGLFFYRASHTLDLEHLIWYLRMLDHPDTEIVP
jgi:hypothetical protein